MHQANPSPYKLHLIPPHSPSSTVQPILDLSNAIHNAKSRNPDHHQTLDGWMSHLNREGSFILHATVKPSDTTSSASTASDNATANILNGATKTEDASPQPEIVGSLFTHPKHAPEYPHPTQHLWIAGVIESEREKGGFRGLMVEAERVARENGLVWLGMGTYPGRFPRMAGILAKLEEKGGRGIALSGSFRLGYSRLGVWSWGMEWNRVGSRFLAL